MCFMCYISFTYFGKLVDSICVPLQFLSRFACIFHDVVVCFVFVCVFRKRKPFSFFCFIRYTTIHSCLFLVGWLFRSRVVIVVGNFALQRSLLVKVWKVVLLSWTVLLGLLLSKQSNIRCELLLHIFWISNSPTLLLKAVFHLITTYHSFEFLYSYTFVYDRNRIQFVLTLRYFWEIKCFFTGSVEWWRISFSCSVLNALGFRGNAKNLPSCHDNSLHRQPRHLLNFRSCRAFSI